MGLPSVWMSEPRPVYSCEPVRLIPAILQGTGLCSHPSATSQMQIRMKESPSSNVR